MLEDKRLIWKFNNGSREALCLIYDKYKHDLLTLATSLLHDVSAGEDVVHDVFVSFIQARGKFKLTGSLKGYLATCVANRARNIIRQMHCQRTDFNDMAKTAVSEASRPDASLIFREELQHLSRSLGQVPYDQREAVLLHLQSGIKFRQIAKLQGVSINTIQGRYRYGLDKLRTLLDSEVKNETSG